MLALGKGQEFPDGLGTLLGEVVRFRWVSGKVIEFNRFRSVL